MKSKISFFLFRALFPSWRFFDASGPRHALFFRRRSASDAEWTPWRPALPKGELPWCRWLWNPRGNERLAYESVVEEFLSDAAQAAESGNSLAVEKSVPYRLLEKLTFLKSSAEPARRPFEFQFKISEIQGDAAAPVIEADLVVSKIHEALPG